MPETFTYACDQPVLSAANCNAKYHKTEHRGYCPTGARVLSREKLFREKNVEKKFRPWFLNFLEFDKINPFIL
jgi:hypothetical protein